MILFVKTAGTIINYDPFHYHLLGKNCLFLLIRRELQLHDVHYLDVHLLMIAWLYSFVDLQDV